MKYTTVGGVDGFDGTRKESKAQEYAQNNTNFLKPLWHKINDFGGSIIEKGQQNQAIGRFDNFGFGNFSLLENRRCRPDFRLKQQRFV